MKAIYLCSCLLSSSFLFSEETVDPERVANTIILHEQAVQNIGIETVVAEEQDFETTVFAIGRIEEIPARRSVLSSRIPGRVSSLDVFPGDRVQEGQVIARIESRQPGSPPPTIKLLAPRAGIVVESYAKVGQPVEPSDEILHVSDRSVLLAVARIPEQEVAQFAIGSKARLTIPAISGDGLEATLIRYGLEADRDSGTVAGIFEVSNSEGFLQPGMRVEFSLITASRDFVLSIPRSAVQGSLTERIVFVKDFELANAFIKSAVSLGEWNGDSVEVLTGVFPGDEVVTEGSYSLSFASGGGGISLKEALDAAHGHEHNEDGSLMTDDQKAERSGGDGHGEDGHDGEGVRRGKTSPLILGWAITATILLILTAQLLWNRIRKEKRRDA